MGAKFWLLRFLKVFAGIFLILLLVELAKGHGADKALLFAFAWSLLSTSVFVLARLYQSRRGRHCELCGDTPELEDANEKPQG